MQASILLLADFANVDGSGKLNVIGAFNRIIAPAGFPTRLSIMHLVIRLTAELGEFDEERILQVKLLEADGAIVWETPEIRFSVVKPEGGMVGEFTQIIRLQNFGFEKPGRYEYRVFVGKDLKGSIPLDLVEIAPSPEE
jgi:hypothetical protein